MKKAKQRFEQKLAENIENDSRSFYAYARSKMKSKVELEAPIGDNGVWVERHEEEAETLMDTSLRCSQR